MLSSCAYTENNDASLSDAFGYSFHPELHSQYPTFPYHEAVAYQKNGITPEAAKTWQDAKIPYQQAIEWRSMGFSADNAIVSANEGLSGPKAVLPWFQRFSPLRLKDRPSAGLLITYAAGSRGAFTTDDVAVVLENTNASFRNYEEVSALARLVHNGEPSNKLSTDLANMRKEASRSNELAMQRQRDAAAAAQAEERQRRIDRYGSSALAMCHDKISSTNLIVTSDNPYSTKGVCVEAVIRSVWGSEQWLDEHTILITDGVPNFGRQSSSIIIDPNGLLRLNAQALLIGTQPTTYTSVLGAQTVAPTF